MFVRNIVNYDITISFTIFTKSYTHNVQRTTKVITEHLLYLNLISIRRVIVVNFRYNETILQ